MEDTCRKYNRTFVHIQCIGRYDSIGATCHRKSDKKCTVEHFVSSIGLCHLPRAEAESHRLSSAPRPLFSSTSFSSLHITKGNLQPLAEGEFCNGTSFCLRQEPVSSVASTKNTAPAVNCSERKRENVERKKKKRCPARTKRFASVSGRRKLRS